jgi:hypothetical protein
VNHQGLTGRAFSDLNVPGKRQFELFHVAAGLLSISKRRFGPFSLWSDRSANFQCPIASLVR